jgi:DNA polymerase III subunit epsilon
VHALTNRIDLLAAVERFEDAAVHRDRLGAFVRSSARMQRLASLTGCAEIAAAKRAEDGGWELHVIRYGRLAAAGFSPRGQDPRKHMEMLQASGETVLPGIGPVATAAPEELETVLRWLESPGVRLVEIDGEWSSPIGGAGAHLRMLDRASEGDRALHGFGERRSFRPLGGTPLAGAG